MRAYRKLAAVSLIAWGVLLGCTGENEPAPPDTKPEGEAKSPATPEDTFATLEATMRAGGPPVRIGFDVVAEGVITAEIVGALLLDGDGRARLEATGSLAGEPLDVSLISDGDRIFWTGNEVGAATPSALRDALGIGFTRMGILHNLARLSGSALPDRAEGGVDAWVTVATTEDRSVLEGAPEGEAAVSVVRAISVAGRPSGTFSLSFSGRTPLVRRQRVDFPEGIMRVTERYRSVEFGASFPPGSFDTTPLDPRR